MVTQEQYQFAKHVVTSAENAKKNCMTMVRSTLVTISPEADEWVQEFFTKIIGDALNNYTNTEIGCYRDAVNSWESKPKLRVVRNA